MSQDPVVCCDVLLLLLPRPPLPVNILCHCHGIMSIMSVSGVVPVVWSICVRVVTVRVVLLMSPPDELLASP